MISLRKIFTVSFIAMMTVASAHAEIVATTMLEKTIGGLDGAAKTGTTANAAGKHVIGVSQEDGKVTVTTGPISYSALADKPTIPAAANNATLTIQRNGTAVGTFTANASENKTINITDNNTTYSAATSSALGLVKSGGDISVGTDGTVTVNSATSADSAATATKATQDGNGSNIVNTYATKSALTSGLAGRQATLTFDDAPTADSSNPVTSDGVKSAIDTALASAKKYADDNDADTKYTLPTAGASTLGGVKIGSNITISDGKISTHAPIAAKGNATTPVYISAAGVATTITSYGGTSAKATADASGNNIVDTYARKDTVPDAYQAKIGYTTENVANKTATIRATGSTDDTKYASEGAVRDAIDALDKTSSLTAGNYVTGTSEANGIVTISQAAMDTTPTADSKKPVTSGGVKTALDAKENVSNKVVEITEANKNSTTHYPSMSAMQSAILLSAEGVEAQLGQLKALAYQEVVTSDLIEDEAVDSLHIKDGTIVNADIADNAAIAQSKINGLTSALDAKENVANKTATIRATGSTDDTKYASEGAVRDAIDALNGSSSGTGNVVTSVTESKGIVTVKKDLTAVTTVSAGTANGTGTQFITGATQNGATVTLTKASIPTATPSTSGLAKVGQIPSGTETSTTYATIWLQ